MKLQEIEITKIVPDKNQPRKFFAADLMSSLRQSIKKDGIMVPLIVKQIKGSDKFQIVDTEKQVYVFKRAHDMIKRLLDKVE